MTSSPASQPTTVRPATAQDAAQISALGTHVFSVSFGHTVTPEQLQSYLEESYSEAAIAADIADVHKDMIVATSNATQKEGENEREERILGFALLTRNSSEPCIAHLEKTVELQRIYIHPDSHGKGVGRALASRLEEMAREQGFRHIWLGVWEHNRKAKKVYEKFGYEKVGEHDFDLGGDVQRDWIMVKGL